MRFVARSRFLGQACGLLMASAAATSWAGSPTVEEALKLAPIQKDVVFDQPTAAEIAKCTLKSEQMGSQSGWVVRTADGQMLRRFVDTNGDNVVDQWSYYDNGVEVYRDIDLTHNGKADQYRWLNTAGTRWGLDANEDGRVDSWKVISAEEATAEVVRAIAERDSARFGRLLITKEELASLGLGSAQVATLSAKAGEAAEKFRVSLTASKGTGTALTSTGEKPKWEHFGGSLPGLVPAGTNGSTKDLLVYENVVAMVQIGDKHDQIPIGTLVQVGETWRVIDAPNQQMAAANSFFFPAASGARPEVAGGGENAPDKELQDLMAKLDGLDKKLAAATAPDVMARMNAERADLVEKIADLNTGEDRSIWLRQMAETISAAVQQGAYPDGVERLKGMEEKLKKNPADDEIASCFEYRRMMSEYTVKMADPKVDFVKVQKEWLDNLQAFIKAHAKSPDTADAMLQLAIAEEFAGQEDSAKDWYKKIVQNFPDDPKAKKAAGACTRLDCVGKQIQLDGKAPDGRPLNLSQYRGKVVVVQYWSTNCTPCINDMVQLKELQAKYGRDGLVIIGVNLDNEKKDMLDFLQKNKLPWPQLWEQGGMDSRLANSMGILTMPTMLLIDKQGKVVNRSIHITQVATEAAPLLR